MNDPYIYGGTNVLKNKLDIKEALDNMIKSFRFAYENFYIYKYIDETIPRLGNYSPVFIQNYFFASHMSSILIVNNLLDSRIDKKNKTMTIEWLFNKLKERIEYENNVHRLKGEINNINKITITKINKLRNKYYAHLDKGFFSLEESEYQISYSEFENILKILKDVLTEIYFLINGRECDYFDRDYLDVKQLTYVIKKLYSSKKS